MRHLVSLLSLLLLVTIGTDTTPLHARTWTDTRGRKLEAEFVQYHPDTAKVTIKLASGSKTTIPLKTLSLIDRQFVKNQHERTVPDCEMITPWEALSWNDTLWQTISTLNKADLEGTITFAPRQPRVSCQLPTAEIRTPAHFQTAIVTLCSKTKAATERLKLPAEPPAIPLISHRALDQPIADIDGTFYLTTERYKINGAIFSLAITYDNHTGLAFLNPELCAKQAKEALGDATVAYLPLYLSSVHLFRHGQRYR